MRRRRRSRCLAGALAALALAAAPAPALAGDDDRGRDDRREITRSGRCGSQSRWTLEVESRPDRIRAEAFVRFRRGAGAGVWRAVVLHERRLVARQRIRVSRSQSSLRVRARFANYPGPDAIVVRLTSPRGETCHASAIG